MSDDRSKFSLVNRLRAAADDAGGSALREEILRVADETEEKLESFRQILLDEAMKALREKEMEIAERIASGAAFKDDNLATEGETPTDD